MNKNDQDPFAKYDKLFDEADKKSVVQPTKEKKNPNFNDLNQNNTQPNNNDQARAKAVRIILTVFFVVLFVQFLPLIIYRNTLNNELVFLPVFSFILIFIIINILIKVFKR